MKYVLFLALGVFVLGAQAESFIGESCGDQICAMTSNTSGWKKLPGDVHKSFVLDNKPMIRQTLGHATWSFLHSVASYLPMPDGGKLSSETKQSFISLVLSLRDVYACALCRHHFDELFKSTPLLNKKLHQIETRSDAILWLFVTHNMVTSSRSHSAQLFVPEGGAGFVPSKAFTGPDSEPLAVQQRVWFHVFLLKFFQAPALSDYNGAPPADFLAAVQASQVRDTLTVP